ncbi:hypothetical protein JOB18_028992 [Solea senegalensis]|uniref:Pre-mRNA cleavage complex 2 protein Pcf11 n=3 Tax=Solea senegalensis TaxID=28829 RepID=A0AAV6SG73_SOLSE|nr:pre-mRNA cleavage complex 2 protein Pcf11 [Solea senegalensis]KAG7516333.1 hypothetical protein JOB18_028992 [Solea senegalensis]
MDCLLLRGCYVTDKAAVNLPCSFGSKMDDSAAREDARREYQSSLEDLTFNSKPHINMLTILAEENLTFAKDIVAIIEAQISKAPSIEKLPVLYLVDSIVKNVGGEYLAVFAKNLITSFICVFEKVDESTRKSLFKLRSTWDEVFPLKKLYALDVRVNAQDPAWPIKPLPPTVNASIHVNPKFLKQSEEAPSPQPAPSKSPAVVKVAAVAPAAAVAAPAAAPAPQPVPAVSQSSVTQEQLIRQQLLAKQKQLLELQQKKIELELEQTKAQLAGGFVLPTLAPVSATPTMIPKPVGQTAPVVRPWIPPQTEADTKPSTRDPRLNRTGTPTASLAKEQPAVKKDGQLITGSAALTPEKSARPDKARVPRKEAAEDKPKSKSPSPMAKSVQLKNKQAEAEKSQDGTKKDPRLKKRPDKSGDAKDDESKVKKRCVDKKDREEVGPGAEPQRTSKGKSVNGLVTKRDREESSEKAEFKSGGNARTHSRKRTRSRSRSRSPPVSPKRKDRRSPKSRARSSSLSPSPSHKPGKPRRVRADELPHGKPGRDNRLPPKKSQSESSRRSKRPLEDRHAESRDSHSPRSHDGGSKETKEALHRWRSAWEEKRVKLSDDTHVKPGPQRHKPYSTPTRPTTPRTPKHRLSVDADMQIPEVLSSASKKDLLRRASQRLESGEISREDFLNMAHQIKHFFQYQEEKLQRSDSWDDSCDFSPKKQQQPPLLPSPPSAQPCPQDGLNAAELSYYEHKSKLRKTQVTHRMAGQEWEGDESVQDGEVAAQGEKMGGGRGTENAPSHKYSRTPRDRPDERRSKEREDPHPPQGPMIEEYNHGKEFPTLKSLPNLRFRRRADPREPSEREWNSPLTERQRYDEREEQKSGYDAPRRYPVDSRHPDPRRPEGPLPSGTVVHRNCPSPGAPDAPAPRFERERLSPLHQKDSVEMSPVPRFESPNSEHSDDVPLSLDVALPPPKSILKAPARVGPPSAVRQHTNSPAHTPPHEGGHPPSRFDGLDPMGPPRPHPPGWYDDSAQFDGPPHQGPARFDGGRPPHLNIPERFDGPIRGGDSMGRFEGHPQGPGRFDGPMGQQPQVRFVGPGPGPGHFEGPMQHFEPRRFENNMAPGPIGFQQQRPMRFEGPPNQLGPMRFEGQNRFDVPGQSGPRYDIPNVSHQNHPHFEGPPRFSSQHNMQPPMRQMAPSVYENPQVPQQNFNMAPQRFPESMSLAFPAGPIVFPAQPNLQRGNYNMQPVPPFSQPGPASFFSTAASTVGVQQPVNMMSNVNQPFLPQSAVPFTPQPLPPENHFGQVDVNDLLTKLISTGIIKPSQPDVVPAVPAESSAVVTPAAAPVEEEEEEEQEVEEEEDDVPDLTSFTVDDLKQRHETVVTKLYSGNQCCLCSMRFTAAQTDMYADHLDWHFRQNHAGKVASKKVTHRRWYYSLRDWIEFEEIADLEERAKSHFFEKVNEEEVQKNQAAAKEKEFQSVRATKDQVGESCEICQEPFETYWVEEEEDWFLKDAVRVDDKNFHPACFEDYKNTTYVDATPSPNKLLTDHPLGSFVKTEEDVEETSCAVAAAVSVKQEVVPEAAELPDMKKEVEDFTEEVKPEESKS